MCMRRDVLPTRFQIYLKKIEMESLVICYFEPLQYRPILYATCFVTERSVIIISLIDP